MKNAMKRVRPLASAQGLAAKTLAGLPNAIEASPAIPDPLRLAIANYHYGMALFELVSEKDWNKAGGEAAVIEATWGAPFETLKEWSRPAMTNAGAVEALGLILSEAEFHASSSLIRPMAKAVLKFLESGRA